MSSKTSPTSSNTRTVKEANQLFAISILLCCIATAGLLYLVHLDVLNFFTVAIIQWVAVVYLALTQNN